MALFVGARATLGARASLPPRAAMSISAGAWVSWVAQPWESWLNTVWNKLDKEELKRTSAPRMAAQWTLRLGGAIQLTDGVWIHDYNGIPSSAFQARTGGRAGAGRFFFFADSQASCSERELQIRALNAQGSKVTDGGLERADGHACLCGCVGLCRGRHRAVPQTCPWWPTR